MCVAHQAVISGPIIRVPAEPSKVRSSFGTSSLRASQSSYASMRLTTSAGSPSIGIARGHANSGRRLSRVGNGARYASRSSSLSPLSTVARRACSMKKFSSSTFVSPTPGVRSDS
jgi:hypothetical protein